MEYDERLFIDRQADDLGGGLVKRYTELMAEQKKNDAEVSAIVNSLRDDWMSICRDISEKNKELSLENTGLRFEISKLQEKVLLLKAENYELRVKFSECLSKEKKLQADATLL